MTSMVVFTHTTVSATGTTAQALAANPNARYRLFQNRSAQIAYLMVNAAATSGNGIALDPGQNYEMTLEAGNLDARAVNVILASGTGSILVTEGVVQ